MLYYARTDKSFLSISSDIHQSNSYTKTLRKHTVSTFNMMHINSHTVHREGTDTYSVYPLPPAGHFFRDTDTVKFTYKRSKFNINVHMKSLQIPSCIFKITQYTGCYQIVQRSYWPEHALTAWVR